MSFWPLETSLADEIRGLSPAIELGGGDGHFARLLHRIDLNPILVDRQFPTLSAAGAGYGRVVGDARCIPIRPASVRLLSCANLLRSMPTQLERVAAEAHRILAPGGRLLILEDEPQADTEPEQNYRDVLRLLAAVDSFRGEALDAPSVSAAFEPRFGKPLLSGSLRNGLEVDDPMRPLRWLESRGLDLRLETPRRELVAKVRRNGMSYGFYWFQLYRRSRNGRPDSGRSS